MTVISVPGVGNPLSKPALSPRLTASLLPAAVITFGLYLAMDAVVSVPEIELDE